jgi:hypothetical protein
MPTNNNDAPMSGWIVFAGILMILHGISQAFLGISALVDKHYLFVTQQNNLILTTAHSNAWGWVDLAIGVFVMAAGFSLLHGSNWARIFAIIFMGLSFLVNIAFLGVFPLWSILAMIIDVFIIYALVVQHDEAA